MKYKRLNVFIDENTHPHLKGVNKAWIANDKYLIYYDEPKPELKHLRVSLLNEDPIHNWMDLQEIKNDLFGEEVVALEVYPKVSDFKNGSNTYHLWTWPEIEVPNLAQLYTYNDTAK